MSIDFSLFKSLTVAGVTLKQLFINGVQVWKSGYKNWVRYSTEADGVKIYNGGLGYKNGYRVRSGGAEGEQYQGSCTGFIPVKGGDVIRISGCDFDTSSNGNAINVSDSSRTNIGQFTMLPASYGILNSPYGAYHHDSVVKEKDGVWKWVVPPAASGVAFIRVSGFNIEATYPGADMIVTVNEEIA